MRKRAKKRRNRDKASVRADDLALQTRRVQRGNAASHSKRLHAQ